MPKIRLTAERLKSIMRDLELQDAYDGLLKRLKELKPIRVGIGGGMECVSYQELKTAIRGFEGPCPDCCNGAIALEDTGDLETSVFAECPKCHGDSRQ